MYQTLVFGLCLVTFVFAAPAARQLDVDENKFVRHGQVLELKDESTRKKPVPDINEKLFVRNGGDILEMNPKYARKRNFIVQRNKTWENGVVPFYIHSSLRDRKEKVFEAMNYISSKTCIRFRDKVDTDIHYMHFFDGYACSSHVGKIDLDPRYDSGTPVELGLGCENLVPASHEIMHALGVYHTQCRSDRDNYITIHYENMFEKAEENINWQKLNETENELLVPFDFDSIMLYGPYMGSANGKPAITANDPNQVYLDTYDKPAMSELDVKGLNLLYNCERF